MSLANRLVRLGAAALLAAAAAAQHDAPAAPAPTAAAAAPKPNACVDCHEKQQGQLLAPVAQWRDSVHGKAGVTCDGCHGGDVKDAAMAHSPTAGFLGRPRLREFPYMCGKCHAEIKDKHLGSVHGANGLPHCVSCHTAHTVAKPDPEQIITEAACSKCHPFAKAKTAQEMLGKARNLLGEIDKVQKEIEHLPSVLAPLHAMQKELHLDRQGVISTFHSFRIGDIQAIGSNADRVLKTIKQLRERESMREDHYARERPIILLLMGFLVLAAAFGYFVFHGKHGGDAMQPHAHADHG